MRYGRVAAQGASVLVLAAGLTAGFEGLRTHAYLDTRGIPTICFGETAAVRPGLQLGDVDTVENCKARFPVVLKKYDDGILACLHREMPDGMHVAMISATYNIGVRAFCHSQMAARINAGDFEGACHALRGWNMAGGVPVLDRRRRMEERACLQGITQR